MINKTYSVEYTEQARKALKKMDRQASKLITAWIERKLINCKNPRLYGKSLTGNRSGQWRYRVGKYRLLADIQDDRIVILIIEIGHRKDIYDN